MAKTEKSFPRNFTGCLTCVQVLNIMVLLGFMLNYALRVNLTIAIVEMIYDARDNVTAAVNVTNVTDVFNNVTQHPEHIEQTRYHWDTKQKNHLLGCFFWGYVMTELPGGRLAEIFGARRIFGFSTLLASILTLLTPAAAAAGFGWAVALRVLLGFFLGATWPAILPMASKWIPPMDRSKFMSNMMGGLVRKQPVIINASARRAISAYLKAAIWRRWRRAQAWSGSKGRTEHKILSDPTVNLTCTRRMAAAWQAPRRGAPCWTTDEALTTEQWRYNHTPGFGWKRLSAALEVQMPPERTIEEGTSRTNRV
ncbi:unnamed protein product [Plutella xylostella]|uniref:(diamondback moth) hypothetical protein n=1 Tax=Plutella xylostella TaxID=51655 RepID=A0A8S4FR22_PLUXY|nr:unnamed protein product [Plutella xylostella]